MYCNFIEGMALHLVFGANIHHFDLFGLYKRPTSHQTVDKCVHSQQDIWLLFLFSPHRYMLNLKFSLNGLMDKCLKLVDMSRKLAHQ